MNPETMARQAQPRRRRPPVGRRSGVGTGTTSLLMIFTVLCFATLAMLSLSTALANQRIQGRGVARGQALAAARGLAAQEMAGLDAELLALRGDAAENGQYYLENAMMAATDRGWQQQEDELTYAWVAPVDAANELVTVIRLEPMNEAERYTVVRQVARLAEGWAPESAGQLWGG